MFKKIFIVFLFLFFSFVTFAQNDEIDVISDSNETVDEDGEKDKNDKEETEEKDVIVVTASKTKSTVESATVPVKVITSKDIEASGNNNVADVLSAQSNLYISRNGGKGGTSSLFLGGAPSESIVYMIDGFKINDITQPSGGFNMSLLSSTNVRQIEVVQGAYSTLYGSDALAGVLNLIPKNGTEKEGLKLVSEYGSYNSYFGSAGYNGSNDRLYGSISIDYNYIDGLSKADEPKGENANFENDTDRMLVTLGKAGVFISKNMILESILYNSNSRVDIDYDGETDEKNHINFENLLMGGLRFKHKTGKYYSYEIKGSVTESERIDNSYNSTYYGVRKNTEFINSIYFDSIYEINFGIEYEENNFKNLSGTTLITDEKSSAYSVYAQNLFTIKELLALQTGLRYYNNEISGSALTYQAGSSVIVPSVKTTIKGSVSTGFKTPSFSELYSQYGGNKDLDSEKSFSYSYGIEQPFFEKISIGANHNYTKFEDKIKYISGENINIAEVEIYENTFYLNLVLNENDYLNISYTRLDAKNMEDDEKLHRRPTDKLCLVLNKRFIEKIFININYSYVGERDDSYWDASYNEHETELDPYHKLDAKVEYKVTDIFNAYIRAENILNQDYQEAYGYTTPGFSIFGGVKVNL